MRWFGTHWGAPLCDDCERVAVTEVMGIPCGHCEELIDLGCDGVLIPHVSETVVEKPYHIECFVRMTQGSLGHQKHCCSCYGMEDVSEQGLTLHEAARVAYAYATRRPL